MELDADQRRRGALVFAPRNQVFDLDAGVSPKDVAGAREARDGNEARLELALNQPLPAHGVALGHELGDRRVDLLA